MSYAQMVNFFTNLCCLITMTRAYMNVTASFVILTRDNDIEKYLSVCPLRYQMKTA